MEPTFLAKASLENARPLTSSAISSARGPSRASFAEECRLHAIRRVRSPDLRLSSSVDVPSNPTVILVEQARMEGRAHSPLPQQRASPSCAVLVDVQVEQKWVSERTRRVEPQSPSRS